VRGLTGQHADHAVGTPVAFLFSPLLALFKFSLTCMSILVKTSPGYSRLI
jgi:hypothetical protein